MPNKTRLLLPAIVAALLMSCFAPRISAQRNPTMQSQQTDAQKDDLYATFSELKRVPVAEKQRLAYEAGKEYLRRYGGADHNPDVKVVRKLVPEYEEGRGPCHIHHADRPPNQRKTFRR